MDEESIGEQISWGDLRPLAMHLRGGGVLTDFLRAELLLAIDRGLFDKAALAEEERRSRQSERSVDQEFEWQIGAFIAVRQDSAKLPQMAAIRHRAAARFKVSEGTAKRRHEQFRAAARKGEPWAGWLKMIYHDAAREMCAEHGIDYFDWMQAMQSGSKFDLRF